VFLAPRAKSEFHFRARSRGRVLQTRNPRAANIRAARSNEGDVSGAEKLQLAVNGEESRVRLTTTVSRLFSVNENGRRTEYRVPSR